MSYENFSNSDYMNIALRMAKRNTGKTGSNPSVGCVIVKNNQIIVTSVTDFGGRPHAEKKALDIIGNNAKDAEIYVTLEPCAHSDKTPSCAQLLIDANVKKVFIGTKDPDPRTSGKGIKKLEDAGIYTEILCKEKAEYIHRGFINRINKKRPFVTLKSALSMDGKISYPTEIKTKKITSEFLHRKSHLMRSNYDAIAIGVNTLISDNPHLGCRLNGLERYSPDIVIFDNNLRGDLTSLNKNARIYIFHSKTVNAPENSNANITYAPYADDIDKALMLLAENGINMLLVEGGAALITSFVNKELYNDIILFRGEQIIGSGGKSAFGYIKNSINIRYLKEERG